MFAAIAAPLDANVHSCVFSSFSCSTQSSFTGFICAGPSRVASCSEVQGEGAVGFLAERFK